MRPFVVTVGAFDGVHRGHQALLSQAVEEARRMGGGSAAVTFDPHPDRVVRPDQAQPELTDLDERVALIHAAGIEDVWVIPFTREVSQMSPEAFLGELEKRWKIARLSVGPDFALGRNRSGSLDVLRDLARRDGWELEVLRVRADASGNVISSTRIRSLLAQGDVAGAAHLLGRRYRLCGATETQDGAREIRIRPERALPRPGAYAVSLDEAGTREARAEVLPRGKGEPGRIRVSGPEGALSSSDDQTCVWFSEPMPAAAAPAGKGDQEDATGTRRSRH